MSIRYYLIFVLAEGGGKGGRRLVLDIDVYRCFFLTYIKVCRYFIYYVRLQPLALSLSLL